MILLPFLFCAQIFAAEVTPDWVVETRHLTGGGDHFAARARVRLRKDKALDRKLREGLRGAYRFYALDLIAALQRKSLFEDLITWSRTDATGFGYLALNSFMNSKNTARFTELYQSRLVDTQTSAAARVILLDTLSRMNVTLPEPLRQRLLLRDESPEVRSAAIADLRRRLLQKSVARVEDLKLLCASAPASTQLRTQIQFLWRELPPSGTLKKCAAAE